MRRTNKWLALCITSLGSLGATINASSINIANPVLAAEFSLTMEQVQWVTTIYLIMLSSLMLLMGRIGDRVGSHRVYCTGACIFALGTLLCGFSGGFVALLGARVIQALGASMIVATSMGLTSTIFPLKQRGTALGINVLMVGLGSLTGPSLGGFILSVAPWHMIFFVIVPFACLCALLAAIFLRSPVAPVHNAPPLDKLGAVILAAIICALILGMSGGFTGSRWFFLALLVLIPALIIVERRQPQPLIEMSLFKNRRFSMGNMIAFLSYSGNILVSFQIPFFLERVWELPVASAGLLLATSALFMALCAPLAGILSDRIGALRLMPIALVLNATAFFLALFMPATPIIPLFVLYLAIAGCGMGLMNTPNNSEIMTAAGRTFSSYASGFVGTNRNLAFCLGTSASAGLYGMLYGVFGNTAAADDASMMAFKCILGLALAFMLASLVLCLYLRRQQRTRPSEEEPS
ncbi:MAG: MFS transporter [Coriobacteriia bacterium]|nr:MFS transporter [Coriobacteriia bacterium]